MELWCLYNKNRQLTKKIMERGHSVPDGYFRQIVHVSIFNSQNQMLIQKRQAIKESWPEYWDLSLGGCSQAGELNWKTAQRETFEELGLELDFSKQRPLFTFDFSEGFDDHYVVSMDLDLTKLKLQAEEVSTVEWASEAEILAMIDKGTFIPYHKSLVSLLFDAHKSQDSRQHPWNKCK